MKSNHIAIVGAGFSGAVIAYHLARAAGLFNAKVLGRLEHG